MNNYEKSFTKPIIRYGSLTNLLAIPLCFIPAIYLWLVKGAFPGWNINRMDVCCLNVCNLFCS